MEIHETYRHCQEIWGLENNLYCQYHQKAPRHVTFGRVRGMMGQKVQKDRPKPLRWYWSSPHTFPLETMKSHSYPFFWEVAQPPIIPIHLRYLEMILSSYFAIFLMAVILEILRYRTIIYTQARENWHGNMQISQETDSWSFLFVVSESYRPEILPAVKQGPDDAGLYPRLWHRIQGAVQPLGGSPEF